MEPLSTLTAPTHLRRHFHNNLSSCKVPTRYLLTSPRGPYMVVNGIGAYRSFTTPRSPVLFKIIRGALTKLTIQPTDTYLLVAEILNALSWGRAMMTLLSQLTMPPFLISLRFSLLLPSCLSYLWKKGRGAYYPHAVSNNH